MGRGANAARAQRERSASALEPASHGVRTQWVRGFMAFQLARRTQIVMRMMLT